MQIKDDSPLTYVNTSLEKSIKAKKYFWEHHSEKVIQASEMMGKTIKSGGKILIFGNGGSAADAQHMAAEMTGRMLVERKKPLAAMALTTDTSAITAIGNDYHFDDIFDLQLRGLGRPGDLAIAISTSGNSKNVLKAVKSAKALGMPVISMTGGKGGALKELSTISLNVELGENSSMIQETHISIVHALVDLMDRFFLSDEYVRL